MWRRAWSASAAGGGKVHIAKRISGVLLILATSGIGYAQSAGAIVASPGLDLSGNWAPVFHEDQPERIPGPELVNYLGLPITDGARMFALSWDSSRLTLPEHQCQVHVANSTSPRPSPPTSLAEREQNASRSTRSAPGPFVPATTEPDDSSGRTGRSRVGLSSPPGEGQRFSVAQVPGRR